MSYVPTMKLINLPVTKSVLFGFLPNGAYNHTTTSSSSFPLHLRNTRLFFGIQSYKIVETVTYVHLATCSFVLSPHKFNFEAKSLCHSLHAVLYHYRSLEVLRNHLFLTVLVSHGAEEGSLCCCCLAAHLSQFLSSETGLSGTNLLTK
jgi:hypothetical protein